MWVDFSIRALMQRDYIGLHIVVVKKTESAASCETVVGVKSGDTCISIVKASQLTIDFFLSINSNVNCKALFMGRWVCIAGSPN
ncbi:hypothetical protein ACSBR2_016950 [Camellia fascicularis]